MSRKINLACDWCTQDANYLDEEDPLENGWLELLVYDTIKEEVVSHDFCSEDCLIEWLK